MSDDYAKLMMEAQRHQVAVWKLEQERDELIDAIKRLACIDRHHDAFCAALGRIADGLDMYHPNPEKVKEIRESVIDDCMAWADAYIEAIKAREEGEDE